MKQIDVQKEFQHLYESSMNGKVFGPYFDGATYNRVKKDKKEDMYEYTVNVSNGWAINSMPVSVCTECPKAVNCTVPAQKKEKTMYVDNDKHIESSKINYLNGRLDSTFYTKDADLRKQFGLTHDEAPRTAAELIQRIQDGKFTIKEGFKDKRTYCPQDYITWRDPAVKEDEAGYKVAKDALDVQVTKTRDTIAIDTNAAALAAIYALETWTPTVGNA